MKATQKLHEMGQSLWLDNITRGLLVKDTLRRYIQEFSITGLTSNPTIFDHALRNSREYDHAIHQKLQEGKSGEALFFELAIEDLRQAADLFRPIYDRTNGVDGWVSLEVSPLLAHDTSATLAAARDLHARAGRPNLFIKIPGTKEGLRGIERRVVAGLNPDVGSVASLFVSRWDVAVADTVPSELRNQLGIAIARETYESYCTLLDSPRSQRILNAGARAQRLLFASTGTKDPQASDTLYVQALAAPFTVNTMPEATLKALADHGTVSETLHPHAEDELAKFAGAGIDTRGMGLRLQNEGAASFIKSWKELLQCIADKAEKLKAA